MEICERHGFQVLEKGTYYMGVTAGSLCRALRLDMSVHRNMLIYYFLFLALYPLSFFTNKLQLGGALYLYLKKR